LWNVGKELESIDVFIRLDKDKAQLERDKERRGDILKAVEPKELLPKPNPDIDKNDFFALKKEFNKMRAPEVEQESYGQYWYLLSKEILNKTQVFLGKKNIAFVNGDLTDAEFMKKIGEVLTDYQAEVVMADLTNVVDGSKKNDEVESFVQTLSLLPFQESCVIKHSAHAGFGGRSPVLSKLSIGLHEYQDRAGRERI
jgi:hypothetical protein